MITPTVLVTTSTSLEGYRVTRQLGLVRGITVRSRSVLGNMAGGFMAISGGRSEIYTQLSANGHAKRRCNGCCGMGTSSGATPSSTCATTPTR